MFEAVMNRPQGMPSEMLRDFSRPNTGRWLLSALSDWAVVATAIGACRTWPEWPVYLAAILLIGSRQHALGVLLHEGVHYLIGSSRFWNELLSDYLAGYPILTPTEGYRAFHLKHHYLLDTQMDPERITMDRFPEEWSFPMARLRFLWLMLRDLIGIWPMPVVALISLIWNIPGRRVRHLIAILLMHGTVTLICASTGHLWSYALLWWLPLLTVFPMAFRLRTAADHSAVKGPQARFQRQNVDVLGSTRTTIGNPISRFLFAPHNISYHIEHHLHPSVPFFFLPQVAKILRKDPQFVVRSQTSKGFWKAISELTSG